MNLSHCPSCLKSGFDTFCPACRRSLFNGKRVSHILPFSRPDYIRRKQEYGTRLSISGVQSKHSLKLNNDTLELTESKGEYILKPIPRADFEYPDALPANEQVTMLIARRIFSIKTAACAIVFFKDDFSPAYLTRRFDILPDGSRLPQEDFAQIAQISEDTHGKHYKYNFSYKKIASLMKRHVSAYAVEIEKFFSLLLFNYLVHNGDAHLKNFSLFRDLEISSYLLTPAYDLLNTRLHLPAESAMALDLFDADFETESFQANGFYSRDDFSVFGERIGIPPKRVDRIINEVITGSEKVHDLLHHSFLPDRLKTRYAEMVQERAKAIGNSFAGTVLP